MPQLKNKIAVVTGGSSGIGLATAKRFAEEGAYVFIAGRRQAEIDKAVAEIGSNATGVKTDIPSSTTSTAFTQIPLGRITRSAVFRVCVGFRPAAREAAGMSKRAKRKPNASKRPKSKLGLPDLDHSKAAVLDSLRSPESKRGYRHAIDEFIQWYCSEPRLSFNKVVVTRFRIFLENRGLAAATINGRLAAVRRLAYEAADAGLLSPELAASIRRVKGPKKLGVRLGNWLTADEARRFWQSPDPETLKGKRDRAILAILLGCGLRRRELADLEFTHLQQREEHWP
jgi:NAD(P)-dependent dehydrogenase (short-subunit alcohol dehydrogenase family)